MWARVFQLLIVIFDESSLDINILLIKEQILRRTLGKICLLLKVEYVVQIYTAWCRSVLMTVVWCFFAEGNLTGTCSSYPYLVKLEK
jgi:hypothetical protein